MRYDVNEPGDCKETNPQSGADKVSSGRWQRGWAYAEAHRKEG
jgi:hypothetical protein